MTDRLSAYKALSIPERLELALSEGLDPAWRAYLVRDQHSQVKIYFSRRLDLRPEEVAILLERWRGQPHAGSEHKPAPQ